MKIDRAAGLYSKIDDRMRVPGLQPYALIFDQRGQAGHLPGLIAEPQHFLASNGRDIEALPQALAKNEELDSCRVTHR